MAKLKSDSPLSRRIVRSFLHFLDSVEPAPGVDLEGLEVARECLAEAFKLDSASFNDPAKPDDLVGMFRSLEASEDRNMSADAPCSSSVRNEENWTTEPHSTGVSKDELFGQFFSALEKMRYFRSMPDGNDDPVQLDRATRLFYDALNEMERSGCQIYDGKSLAETLKCQGNKAMQSKLYSDAIELYSIAIALYEENAVYYCNRAAAYTQIHKYNEAIIDCLKSIEIDPNYSKAYSRLGLAHYAQGNYSDAIEKGFKKALEMDPNNESVKENIRVAEQKLRDEFQRREGDQHTSSSQNNQGSNQQSGGGPRSHDVPPAFSMPFNTSALPADFASMLMNMAANAFQGQAPQNRQEEDGNTNGSEEPGIRFGGNINVNLGEHMPEELSGALRSMMEMFSGTSPHGNSQDTTNGRPAGS